MLLNARKLGIGTHFAKRRGVLPAFVSGALLGLVNLGHCAGMCGPLAAVGCRRSGPAGRLRYQLGRALSYGFAGAICGHVGRGVWVYTSAAWASWVFAALTAAACLFAAYQLARAERSTGSGLVELRSNRNPARRWLGTLFRLMPRDPLPLGLLSVLLPCGLLAAALLASVATGGAEAGAALMTGFAAVSGGAILGAGWIMQRALRVSVPLRRGLACLLVAGALASFARPIAALAPFAPTSHSSSHSCH